MIDPEELIETSRKLLIPPTSDADIRRAISTGYYAIFHALANSNAEAMVGQPGSTMSAHAWERVYRRLDHGRARNNLRAGLNLMSQDGSTFAELFIEAQGNRLQADYDPNARLTLSRATNLINRVARVINNFSQLPGEERRFLAAQSMLDGR